MWVRSPFAPGQALHMSYINTESIYKSLPLSILICQSVNEQQPWRLIPQEDCNQKPLSFKWYRGKGRKKERKKKDKVRKEKKKEGKKEIRK